MLTFVKCESITSFCMTDEKHFATSLRMLKLWFLFSAFFSVVFQHDYLPAERTSFNVCMLFSLHFLLPNDLRMFVRTQNIFREFYKLFTTNYTIFPFFFFAVVIALDGWPFPFFRFFFVKHAVRLHIKLQLLLESICLCFFLGLLSPRRTFSAHIKSFEFVSFYGIKRSSWRIAKSTQR